MSSSASTVNPLCQVPTPVDRSPRCPEQRRHPTSTTWSMMTRQKTTSDSAAEQDTHIVILLLHLPCQCSLHHQQRHSQKRARLDRLAPAAPSRIDEATPTSKTKKILQHTCASRHSRQHSLCRRLSRKIVLTSMVYQTAWTPQKKFLLHKQMWSSPKPDAVAAAWPFSRYVLTSHCHSQPNVILTFD
jgi:hypothetical protein